MTDFYEAPFGVDHDHVFLGTGHEKNERKTWAVIALCSVMMIAEIIGGSVFGSLALVADGLHMSTHAGAMLIAAVAYTYARRHANDPRFVFGTGKLGDLAGFTSAIILAMIALLIGYEAVARFMSPVPIHFNEAIFIAVVGLLVNVASAWLLSGNEDHGHSHSHVGNTDHDGDEDAHAEEVQQIETPAGILALSIFEKDVPPVFRVDATNGIAPGAQDITVTTVRSGGVTQAFAFTQKSGFLESTSTIPEPHEFDVLVKLRNSEHTVAFKEHGQDDHVDARDHNMRAAYIHVIADAAVSVLAIIGLILAKSFGWLWMDPVAGLVGALVIANWSFGLVRDTGAILLDMNKDEKMANKVRAKIKLAGDKLVDLHVWRLGPGHFGAIVSVLSDKMQRSPSFYHTELRQIKGLSHITVEVHSQSQGSV